MKRIAMTESFFEPKPNDFNRYDARILLSRLLTMYVLNDKNEVDILLHSQLEELAFLNGFKIELAKSLAQIIKDIPTQAWKVINQKVGITQ